MKPHNHLILLAGPSTSGTGFLAAVLHALGGRIPEARPGSAGFADPPWVTAFHSKLLKKAGVHDVDARPSAWAMAAAVGREPGVVPKLKRWLKGEFAEGDHLAVKEPRLAWFIPAWRRAGEAVAEPSFVTVVRHPLEVIAPADEEWHANARVAGWINMTLYTERATRDARRVTVRYEDLSTDSLQTITRLADELKLEIVERATPPEMRSALGVTDSSTKRSSASWESLGTDQRLVDLAEETHSIVHDAAGGDGLDDDKVRTKLDQLRQRYLDLYEFIESTGQFSIAAGPEGNAALGKPTYDPNRQDGTVKAGVKKLLRRTARTREKTVRRLRRGSPTPALEPGTTSSKQPTEQR